MVDYAFYYFGPHLFHTKVDLNFCNELLTRGSNKKENCAKHLAGYFDTEYAFNEDDKYFFLTNLEKVFKTFSKSSQHFYNEKMFETLKLKNLWINFMHKGDFNPMHTHSGDLSFVLFLKVPDELKQENREYSGTDNVGPGAITFGWGEHLNGFVNQKNVLPETGDFFIFPAGLRHMVYPFKSDVERVSVAGNFDYVR